MFSKEKFQVLHLGYNNPKQSYRRGEEWLKNYPEEEDLGMVVNSWLGMSAQVAKDNDILICIKIPVDSRARELILPLNWAPHL